MNLWVVDPATKKPSVSLSIMLVMALCSIVASFMVVVGKATTTAEFTNLFWGSVALYFGRRNLNIGGKTYSAEEVEKIEEKLPK